MSSLPFIGDGSETITHYPHSASAEYTFSLLVHKFCISAGSKLTSQLLASDTLSRVIKQIKKLDRSYTSSSHQEKIQAITQLEEQLLDIRNGNFFEALRLPIRELYKGVVNERNRLFPAPNGSWPVRSEGLEGNLELSRTLLQEVSDAAQNAKGEKTV